MLERGLHREKGLVNGILSFLLQTFIIGWHLPRGFFGDVVVVILFTVISDMLRPRASILLDKRVRFEFFLAGSVPRLVVPLAALLAFPM